MADSHEHGNETWCFIEDEELLDSLKGYQFLKSSVVARTQYRRQHDTRINYVIQDLIKLKEINIEPGLLETIPDWNKLPSLCKQPCAESETKSPSYRPRV
jgi:hypothetical protein